MISIEMSVRCGEVLSVSSESLLRPRHMFHTNVVMFVGDLSGKTKVLTALGVQITLVYI